MARIREEIEIVASREKVWKAVHVDIPDVPQWSRNLVRTEVVGGGALGAGTRLRYEVRIAGGRTAELELRVDVCERLERCAGIMSHGPVSGNWSWTYTASRRRTLVVYESEVKVGGLLRMVAPVIERDIANGVRTNLSDLKAYVETGATVR